MSIVLTTQQIDDLKVGDQFKTEYYNKGYVTINSIYPNDGNTIYNCTYRGRNLTFFRDTFNEELITELKAK